MNNKIFVSFALTASLMVSHAALANNEQAITPDPNQPYAPALTNSDVQAKSQGYLLEQAERPQVRRSALFAHILDTMAKNATMASADIMPLGERG